MFDKPCESYKKYEVTFGKKTHEIRKVTTQVFDTLSASHLPDSGKRNIKLALSYAGLYNYYRSYHHLIKSANTVNPDSHLEHLESAEKHFTISVAKTYITAIKMLISTHEFYCRKYNIPINSIEEKSKKIEDAKFLCSEMVAAVNSDETLVTIKEINDLRSAFEKCIDVVRCHRNRANIGVYKGIIRRVAKYVSIAIVSGIGVVWAVSSNLISENEKERLTEKAKQFVCDHTGLNCNNTAQLDKK